MDCKTFFKKKKKKLVQKKHYIETFIHINIERSRAANRYTYTYLLN